MLSLREPLFFSSRYNDIFFDGESPTLEKNFVFLKANRVDERLGALSTNATLTIGELGFGFGINAALTFCAAQKAGRWYNLRYFSVDETFPPAIAQEKCAQLFPHDCTIYPQLWNSIATERKSRLNSIYSFFNNKNTHLFHGDVLDFINYLSIQCASQADKVDIWYFDGFTPAKNPAMWSGALFAAAFQLTKIGGTFSTYTAAGWVKRNLISAGFHIEKVKGFGQKRDMLVGTRLQ